MNQWINNNYINRNRKNIEINIDRKEQIKNNFIKTIWSLVI